MNVVKQKVFIALGALLISIVVPVLILMSFFLIFPDFYSEGFLTGLGQIILCGIIIMFNAIFFPCISVLYFKKFINDYGIEKGKIILANRLILLLVVSAVVQIVLSIIIENPFKDPKLPNFPM